MAGAAFGVSPELVRRAAKLEHRRTDLAEQVLTGELALSEARRLAAASDPDDHGAKRSACVVRFHLEYQLPSTKWRWRGPKRYLRESKWIHRSFELDLGAEALDYTEQRMGRVVGRFMTLALSIEGYPIKTRTWTPTAKDLELIRGTERLDLCRDGSIRIRTCA